MTRPRRIATLLHRYVGLVLALFLTIVGLTGATIAWNDELERVFAPSLFVLPPADAGRPPLDPFALRDAAAHAVPGFAVKFGYANTTTNLDKVRRVIYGARALACDEASNRLGKDNGDFSGWMEDALADNSPFTFDLADDEPVAGRQPDIPRDRWRLEITGLVETPFTLDWHGLTSLVQSESRSDIHCVTSWSRYDNDWVGVATTALLDVVQPLEDAAAVLLHSSDGYTTNLTLDDFAAPGVLLAHTWQGGALERQHGGPVRLVVPHLYFWKSAKWISAIEFRSADDPGYWEANGYHLRGDPWNEERYS